MTVAEPTRRARSRDAIRRLFFGMRPRRNRTLRRWCEEEIIIPDGPFEGLPFSCKRQPFSALWFDAVDSGRWRRHVATGPVQTGKTLIACLGPALHAIFELEETVVFGLPDMAMAGDKWRNDLLPVIDRTRYRELLPKRGAGSRGGNVEAIRFQNGAELKFMSGGGSDKSRAAYTARVIVITEVDGLATTSSTSVESDKVTQIEQRAEAYPDTARIFLECTATTKDGRIWQEYTKGSKSVIVMRCPLCLEYVNPEREHLRGWRDADDEQQAGELSAFFCPSCGEAWDETDRKAANLDACMLHATKKAADEAEDRGMQTIDAEGRIEGEAKRTDTLGFRWSSVHNRFTTAEILGKKEFRAANAHDPDNAERAMCQFVWCIPYVSNIREMVPLDVQAIINRTRSPARGVVPDWCDYITAGVDIGKYLAHWTVIAWAADGTSHIIDYGRQEVASVDLGEERAIMLALTQLQERFDAGYHDPTLEGERRSIDQVWIDSGWHPGTVHAFCRQVALADLNYQKFRPCVGRGRSQMRKLRYQRPTKRTKTVITIGDNFHFIWLAEHKLAEAVINADHWKTYLHRRLAVDIDKPSAMTILEADRKTHISFANHLIAEREVEEFDPRQGLVTRWEQVKQSNHWLDASYYACAAASLCGVEIIPTHQPQPQPKPRPLEQPNRSSGRPWLISER